MTRDKFNHLISGGVVLLDGATGSQLRAKGMPVGVSTELWAYEHPEVIVALQRAYVDAGSDIIYAPTFSANRVGLGMHGLEHRLTELNAGLVKLSKQAAGGRALVAGDFTTTGKPLEPVGTMSYQALLDIYREQIEVVADAGADLLGAETMLTVDECACFVEAARSVCDLPVMCTLTIEADGHRRPPAVRRQRGGCRGDPPGPGRQRRGAELLGGSGPAGGRGGVDEGRGHRACHRQAQRRNAGDGRSGPGPLQHDPGAVRRVDGEAGAGRGQRHRRLLRHRPGIHRGVEGDSLILGMLVGSLFPVSCSLFPLP